MKIRTIILCAVGLVFMMGACAQAVGTEDEIIQSYLKKAEKKHIRKISWVAASFEMNRINRHNPYNDFAIYNNTRFSNAEIPWLSQAPQIGFDFGVMFAEKYAWTIGGEYWLKIGTNEDGSFQYTPPLGTQTTVENLISEIQVYGLSTGIQHYLVNPPTVDRLGSYSLRAGTEVGYYWSTWDLWSGYENLNLVTSAPTGNNTTFNGSAPGFKFTLGGDYALNFFEMALAADFGYQYLNFNNVAWYNGQDEEIVATTDGTVENRVDLDLSGFTAKFELKRFFKW